MHYKHVVSKLNKNIYGRGKKMPNNEQNKDNLVPKEWGKTWDELDPYVQEELLNNAWALNIYRRMESMERGLSNFGEPGEPLLPPEFLPAEYQQGDNGF